jgi:flagellar assembly protein FliH
LYSTRILKSRYISVVEPVTIDTEIEEFEVTELEENEFLEEEQQDPENVAADIIAKAREEAVAILEEYQRQLEEMKQKHEQEMEEYRKEVEKTAYEEGYNKGYDEGRQSFESALQELDQESQRIQDSYKKLISDAEPQVISLVLGIAQKVVDGDVKVNKENMISLVRKALDIAYEKQNASIKLSSKDYEYLKENAADFVSQINSYENISIKEDMTLSEGDCIIDSPNGTVDLGINRRFEKIADEFIKENN